MQASLPTVEELERELTADVGQVPPPPRPEEP
jgi:hypothetical protein